MAFKLNGKTLPIDRGFTHNDIQYPKNWLRLSTQEDKDALGITWEADPVRHDDRYYWNGELDNPKALEDVDAVDEDGNPVWEQELDNSDPENPVMVDTDVQVVTHGLKHTMINQVKHTAGTMLANTDWYVTRKAEREVAIPEDVVAERAHVVAESERLEVAITACADVEALIEVMNNQNWGE
ncbi:hypothetical protein N9J50_01765 [Methylophilaceae bacterium]|nr:hypothetical protein [Methylophilaceae bacterium]